MGNEEQLIREKMERTRESISEKLDVLENRIVGKVEQASTAVSETATSVKEAFDLNVQMDRHPWLMVGGAVAAGLVAGHLLQSNSYAAAPAPRLEELRAVPQPASAPAPPPWTPTSAPAPASKPGILSEFEPELVKAKELAIGVTLGIVREAVTAEMSPALKNYAGEIFNALTQKLGGRPMSGSDLPFVDKPSGSPR